MSRSMSIFEQIGEQDGTVIAKTLEYKHTGWFRGPHRCRMNGFELRTAPTDRGKEKIKRRVQNV